MSCRGFLLPLLAASLFAVSPARGDLIFDESTLGDFSTDGLAPTSLAVAPGSNSVLGTTGRPAGPIDQDYVAFVIPDGYQWSALFELPGTVSGGSLSFIGVQAGSQVTVSPSAPDATGLLGWTHFNSGAIGFDLLPFMGSAGLGSAGFTPPLPAGAYALWIQDFNAGTFAYGFDIRVTIADEPQAGILAFLALSLLGRILNPRGGSRRTIPR